MYPMNIGQAAAAAGVTPKMIRHYEALGLVPEPDRTDAGYRLYGEREVGMLRFIRQARGLGFSMQQIESLMSLWRDEGRQSAQVKAVALKQLQELEQRQRELDQMRSTLEGLVRECHGDADAHCPILDTLAGSAVVPAPAEGIPRARRALKQVRAGEKRALRRERPQRVEPPQRAHVALSAWMQGVSRAA